VTLVPDAHLGPYEILSAIGAGGMGEVYRARDSRLGRDVAIKILPPAFSTDAERLQRFEQEARATAALNHPNILAIHDIGQHVSADTGHAAPYIVSELLDGQTLRERQEAPDGATQSPLPVRKAIDYVVQIARGLTAAHDKGIVHRDLKPENIFITSDDRVKILDFGLAKLTQTDAAAGAGATMLPTSPQTVPGVVFGTMGYMAPEQVRGLPTDHRADIFALGAILYEMVSGHRAFQRDTPADTMSAILTGDPPALSASQPIPPALTRIVDRCLEKSPMLRFQTAADLAFAVEALTSHSGMQEAAGPIADARVPRQRPLPWMAAAAVLFVTSLALAALLFMRREPIAAPAPVYRSTIAPLSTLGGNLAARMALSPDGRRLAIVAPDTRNQNVIWVHSLESVAAQALAGTEGANSPWWSPDSRHIAFFAGGKVKKIDASGGAPVTLTDARGSGGPGAWNRDDVILFPSAAEPPGFMRVAAAGGASSPVTKIDTGAGEVAHGFPVFLPDGKNFLYLAIGTGGAPSGVFAASLDSTDRTRVMPEGSNIAYANGSLLFMRDTTLMAQSFDASRRALVGDAVTVAEQLQVPFLPSNTRGLRLGPFSVSQTGVLVFQTGSGATGQLTWFDRSGKQLGTVGDRADFGDLFLSPDGTRATASLRSGSQPTDSWVIDLARGVRTRFTFDPSDEFEGVWSPDGNTIAFNSSRKGRLDLYQKSASGVGGEELLYADNQDKYAQSYSPDGRYLLYIAVGATTGQDVWVLPLTGDRKPIPIATTRFNEGVGASFSPDGRWIAYSSNESGRSEVYVVPFQGPGGKAQVSTKGGSLARWRRDGRELFYAADGKIHAATVSVRGSTFEVGEVRPLFEVRSAGPRYFYDVTGDGPRFLINTAEAQSVMPLTLVVNWPGLIRR
jgi:Tol biopolymer transport system component